MYLSTFILSALPLLAQAGNQHLNAFRNPRDVHRRNNRTFNLIDKFKGNNFFEYVSRSISYSTLTNRVH